MSAPGRRIEGCASWSERNGAGVVSLVDPERAGEVLATSDRRRAWPTSCAGTSRTAALGVDQRLASILPRLLAAGVRVERCHDLRLCGAILAGSTRSAAANDRLGDRPAWLPRGPNEGAAVEAAASSPAVPAAPALFDLDESPNRRLDGEQGATTTIESEAADATAPTLAAIVAEHDRQLAVVRESESPAALRLLLAAESAGALIGSELQAAGLPWNRAVHERVLEAELGPRPPLGRKPVRMEELAATVRAELGAPALNLDSQVDLLRALQRAGLAVTSTSRWELREHEHPAIEPVIAYKKLARLLGANGWAWIEEWVADGRFRPDYVPGGTATGRWATSGGGALQLPKNVRAAVTADPGLAARRRGCRAARAPGARRHVARHGDGRGRPRTRPLRRHRRRGRRRDAVAGEDRHARRDVRRDHGRERPARAAARPRLPARDGARRRGRPRGRARQVGHHAARAVLTPTRSGWHAVQSRASQPDATAADERRARSTARDWGRFTRNFVVQGSAAEWALCWMAALRPRLTAIGEDAAGPPCRGGIRTRLRAHAAPRVLPARRDHRAHAAEHADEVAHGGPRTPRTRAGRAALRRLPGRLPARPGDRRQLRVGRA